MADGDPHLSMATPDAPVGSPASHFYPFATSPDIIRSHEKDAFLTGALVQQAQSIVRTLRGARYAHAHSDAIKHLTELLYFSLTTAIGNRTLGEEYCDLVQLEDDTLRLPAITRRVGYILSSILVPWSLQRLLPVLRQRVRNKLERSIAKQQLQAAQLLAPHPRHQRPARHQVIGLSAKHEFAAAASILLSESVPLRILVVCPAHVAGTVGKITVNCHRIENQEFAHVASLHRRIRI